MPPPYRDFAHNFAPFFGRCCPQKRFISLNFGAILNLAFLSVPTVPFGGIAGQINRQRRGYHEKTHREHDTGAQYDALHPPCIRICGCRGRVFFRGGAIVIVAAVSGAAIGVGAHIAGTTAYLKSVLPEGMAIPANRQQLAVALWSAAGKPATQSTALFNDVAADAAELQAIRWVVETGLMTAQDGNFKPGSRVGRMEVIRTWKAYQQRG